MKDNTKVTITILFVILVIILSIIPLTVNSQVYENSYGKLEVYPDISRNIIRQKQYFNATSYLPSQALDIAFRFNESLTYGGVYYFNNDVYNKLNVNHVEYNDKHWYILNDIYFEQYEMKHGYWEYDVPIGSSGKWDMFIKRSSDSLQYALENNLFVHLDPWWNSSFNFLNSSYICNAIENYSVNYNFTYADEFSSKCLNNFSDVYFVGDNTTLLNFWIEDVSNGSWLNVWINISDASTLDVYYNSTVYEDIWSRSNGSNTFLFFDDFSGDAIDTDKWTPTADVVVSSGIVTIGGGTVHSKIISDYFSMPSSFRSKVRMGGGSAYLRQSFLDLNDDDSSDFILCDAYPDTVYFSVRTRIAGGSIYTEDTSTEEDDSWHIQQTDWKTDEAKITLDDIDITTVTSYVPSRTLFIRFEAQAGSDTGAYVEVDWVFKRKYTDGTEPTFCNWTGEIEKPSSEILITSESPINNTEDVEWANLNITVLLNNTWGYRFNYANISIRNDTTLFYTNFTNIFNGTIYLNESFNFSSATWFTWYVNVSSNDTTNFSWFKFKTFGVTLDDLYNLQAYMNNKIIGVDDELDINLGLDGTLLTLALFGLFFIVGYIINKRSGGVLMLFSGFILISFELIANINLDALYLVPLLTPIAILIMILGVRKWLFMPEGEKTKSEGQ